MSKVFVMDLELNQPSGKIIQIGYIIADIKKDRILRKRSLIVDPREPLGVIPNLNVHISDYTGITETDIKFNGRTLQESYEIVKMDVEELRPNKTVVQWGCGGDKSRGDHDCLRQQLGLSWDEYLFRMRTFDAKAQYQMYRLFNGQSVVNGLGKALESVGLEFEGRPHDALDDAINTYRLFKFLGDKAPKFDKIKSII